MIRSCWLLMVLGLGPSACGSSSHAPPDGDADRVDSGSPPDCSADPQAEGCPCDGAPTACFDGDHAQVNVGLCRAGLQRCEDGLWTPCYGATHPADEVCDGQDEDCDGVVDDGVLNDCGTCEGDCEVLWIGAGNFDPGRESFGAVEDDDGALVVDANGRLASRLWIGSGTDGTVSVLDTEERRVTGRYVVIDDGVDEPLSVAATPWGGAAVVVGGSGGARDGESLVRIGLAPCPDTNGDGAVRTSSGSDDVLPYGQDDCLLWRTPFDTHVARGVAWEPRAVLGGREDFIWVGVTDDEDLRELDDQGEWTGRRAELGFTPAGIVLMPDGRLAVASAWPDNQFAFVDTVNLDVTALFVDGGSTLCSIATDLEGDVYIPNDLGSLKVDGETGRSTPLPQCLASVAASDRVYWGGWCEHELVTTSTELDDITQYAFPDRDAGEYGVPWVVLTTNDQLWIMDSRYDSVLSFEPDSEEFELVVEDIPSPGTCGDVTGVSVMRAAGTPVHYQRRFDGCDETTRWTLLFFSTETPPGTRIDFSVQVANDEVDLADAPIVAVGSAPADASSLPLGPFFEDGGPRGAILVVHASLVAAGQTTPRLLDLGVARVCEE